MSTESAIAVQVRTQRFHGISRSDVARAKKLIAAWPNMERDREFCVELGVLPADSLKWCERGKLNVQRAERGEVLTQTEKLYAQWYEIIEQAGKIEGNGYPADNRPRLPMVPATPVARRHSFRLTDEVIEAICADIRKMIPYAISLETLGFSRGVWQVWMAEADRADARVEVGLPPEENDGQYLKFRQQVAIARRDVISRRMNALGEIGDGDRRGDPSAITWMLERLYPIEFKQRVEVEQTPQQAGGGGGVTLILNQTMSSGEKPALMDADVIEGHSVTLRLPDSDFADTSEEEGQ